MTESGGKTPQRDWLYDRPNGGDIHTYDFLRKRVTEDRLDHLHRLLKHNIPIELISQETGLPIESVEHVIRTNGYAATYLKTPGVHGKNKKARG